MTSPRISIALGTYNGERFLEQQLESIASQTLAPCEVVLADDGSTDGTLAIAERFAAHSPFPVRITRAERNLGFAENFLGAARRCRGELVAFCDQDDVWLDTKLERCAAAFDSADVVLAIHASRVVDGTLAATGTTFPAIRTSHVVPALASPPWYRVRGMGMVFSRRLLRADASVRPRSHYLRDGVLNHDEWIYLLAHVAGSIAFIAEPLALYRQHGANAVGAPSDSVARRLAEVRRVGFRYYGMRLAQARECMALFERLSAAEDDPALRARYGRGVGYYDELARGLEDRVLIYDPRSDVRTRWRALAALLTRSAYRRRRRGGFGYGALAKDAAAALMGWPP